MASRLFGNNSNVSSIKYFEIRVDQNNLTLRGTEDEASSVLLKGMLVLCLAEPLKVQSVRLRFTGEKRVGWGTGSAYAKKDEEFFRHGWEFVLPGKRSGETLTAGNYEWPFELVLPGSSPESIEGLQDSWIIYRMKATIDRGLLAQNALARKHVRVIRTLDSAALELSHAMSVENTWVDKIDYTLSTPMKGVIFGTTVKVDFRIASLLKGLKIGEVSTKINETQDMVIDIKRQAKKTKISREIVHDTFDFPQAHQTEIVDGLDAWVFSRHLALPRKLRQCLQTVDVLGIKIRHNLNFNVKLINPDGHISELHATLPLHIYISPNLLLDDDNNMVVPNSQSINSESLGASAPPLYGEHQFDQLYSDVDSSAYMTPSGGLSGVGTPFNSGSRRASTENLAMMNTTASNGITATALQTRLNNLDAARSIRPPIENMRFPSIRQEARPVDTELPVATEDLRDQSLPASSVFSSNHLAIAGEPEQGPSGTMPRRGSRDDSVHCGSAPQHVEFGQEEMCKVPSYSTALRSRTQTPISEGPPTYQSATRSSMLSNPIPQPLTPAHVH